MTERERCGRGQERHKHIIHIFILQHSCALTLLPSREIDRSTNFQIDDLEAAAFVFVGSRDERVAGDEKQELIWASAPEFKHPTYPEGFPTVVRS